MIASFLALVMFLSSNVGLLPISAEGAVEVGSAGIGVFNRVLTDDEEANVVYRLTFRDANGVAVDLPTSIHIGDFYLDRENQTFILPKNTGIDFSSSPEFMEFLNRYHVTFLSISPDRVGNGEPVGADENDQTIFRDKYCVYPNETQAVVHEYYGGYSAYYLYEGQWLNFETDQTTITALTSTKYQPVDVERSWRDRGTNRGALVKSDFIIQRDGVTQQIDDLFFSLDNTNSNHTIYSYYLPEYSVPKDPDSDYEAYYPTGTPVLCEYTAVSNLEDTDFHRNIPGKGTTLPDTDEDGDYDVTSFGLTTMDFTLQCLDAAKKLWTTGTAAQHEALIRQYLTKTYTVTQLDGEGNEITLENVPCFQLRDKQGELISFTADDIEVTESAQTPGVFTVKIHGLIAIAEDSTAMVYELIPSAAGNLPLISEDGSTDHYDALAANPGVNSAVSDKVYQDGTLTLLLRGERGFSGTVDWRDQGVKQDRVNRANAAQIVVWRYVDTGKADDIDRSAQVETITIPGSGSGYDESGDVYSFSLSALSDKYDNQGRPYVYYAKEKVLITNDDVDHTARYEIHYPLVEEGSTTKEREYLLDGENVENWLSAMRLYSVDAKWIAAARQGGEASATFVLQRKKYLYDEVTGEPLLDGEENPRFVWIPVPGDENGQAQKIDRNGQPVYQNGNPVMVSASTVTISDFQAEAMELREYFPKVPVYDEEGYIYEYRVVQTSVTRKDSTNKVNGDEVPITVNFTGDQVISTENYPADGEEDGRIITIGNDTYLVGVAPDEQDPYRFDFTYKLEGKVNIRMHKDWEDIDTVDHSGETVQFQIKYVPFGSGTLENYGDVVYVNGQSTDYENDETDGPWWKTVFEADRYDELGHEVDYYVFEINAHRPDYYSTYEYVKDNTVNPAVYTYTVTNHPKGDGDIRYVGLRKEWADDGELEFREPIEIQVQGDYEDENQQTVRGVYSEDQKKTVSDESAWVNSIVTYRDFTLSDENAWMFTEHMPEILLHHDASEYWTAEEIFAAAEGSELNNSMKWIYELLAKRHDILLVHDEQGNPLNYTAVQEQNYVAFNNLVGVFRNDQHYYAVEQFWNEESAMNGMDGEIVFRNTRIGVVSIALHLDWHIGDEIENVETIRLKVSGRARIQVPNDPEDPDSGYHWDYGEPHFEEYDVPVEVLTDNGIQNYYILNLSKYDNLGQIIDYQVEEVSVNGITVNDGAFTFNGNKCQVSVTNDGTNFGGTAYSHSEDLIQITITNTFANKVSFTVHKHWHDLDMAMTRPDLYIKLYRVSSNTNSSAGSAPNVSEYIWNHQHGSQWTYTFTGLDEFDKDGYRYTYYVVETPLAGYATRYDNTDASPVLADENLLKTAAFNGGTIHNTLYDEVVINGEKLWQRIPEGVAQEDYPIATIYLSIGMPVEQETEDGEIKTVYVPDPDKLIALTQILNGASSFHFQYDAEHNQDVPNNHLEDPDAVIWENGKVKLQGINIVLPKYDEDGRRITYVLSEKPINGYVFRISDKQIVNDYTGGRPVTFDVTKEWNFNGATEVYPEIKAKLYQTYYRLDASGQPLLDQNNEPVETVFMVYEQRLTQENGWQHTFGLTENLREFAPNGTEFHYYVTEVLSNNDTDDPVELVVSGAKALGFVFEKLEESVDSDEDLIEWSQHVRNTYAPDDENFMGELTVSKTWNNKDGSNTQNRDEFGEAKGYVFSLSRKTRNLPSQSLFSVTTLDSYEGGALPSIAIPVDSPIAQAPIAFTQKEGRFTASIPLDNKVVTVTVDPTSNTVDIQGLAIYARDAVHYDYTVTEETRKGYLRPMPISARISSQNEPALYSLENELDTVDLRLYKRFAAEVGDGTILELDSAHFRQYFNEDYLLGLEFQLCRKTENEETWTVYESLSGAEWLAGMEAEGNAYRYVFRDLPKYNAAGEKYDYRVIETKNGGEVSGTEVNHVKTQYLQTGAVYSEPISYTGTGAPAGTGSQSLRLADWDGNEAPSFTVRNIFPAALVSVEKVWDDDHNADGMRPDRLKYRLFERVPNEEQPEAPTVIKTDEDLTDAGGWSVDMPLPIYYFNGRIVGDLEFKLDENLPRNPVEGEGETLATEYERQYNTLSKYGYTREDEQSNYTYTLLPQDGVLKLTNRKEPVNGSIGLTKTFRESEGFASLRPETVYFKLYRVCAKPLGSYVYTDSYNLNSNGEYKYDFLNVEAPYNQYALVTEDQNGVPVGNDGVIPVTADDTGAYALTVDHLPIGVSQGGDVDANGKWYLYVYRFVECDAQGNEYQRDDTPGFTIHSDTFSYHWHYTGGANEHTDNAGQHLAVQSTTGPDAYQTAHRDQSIENVLKTTSYSFEKIWEDQENIYDTRRPITVRLERKLATDPDVPESWKTVYVSPVNTEPQQPEEPGQNVLPAPTVLTPGDREAAWLGLVKPARWNREPAPAAVDQPTEAPVRGAEDWVAQDTVTGQGYATLQEALNAGGNIRLLTDLDLGSATARVPAGVTVTLDLNGHNLTADGLTIYNLGDLTIQDSTGTPGTVTSTGSNTVGCGANSTTTIESGSFHARECAVCTFAGTHDATVNISGGSFYTEDNSVLSGNGSANSGNNTWNVTGGSFEGHIQSTGYVACGIYAPNTDTWNVTGGSFRVYNGAGVVQRAGVVNLGDGVTIETDGAVTGKVGDSRVVVPCSALVYDSAAAYPQQNASSRMNVTGGSYTSADADAIRMVGEDERFAVSGGTFSSPVPPDCCEPWYSAQENPDHTYTVSSGNYVARIGDRGYETLQEALNAGGNVVLLADVDLGSATAQVPAGVAVTLDLNGRSLTSSRLTLYNQGTLTVRDSAALPGSITSTGSNTVGCGADSTTTIESGSFHARECAVCTFAGTHDAVINISGGSFSTEDNSVLSGNGSANSGNNTWNVTGGSFEGHIQSTGYVACGIYAPNTDTWNVTGGSFRVYNGAGVVQRAGVVNLGDGVTIETDGAVTGKVGDSRVVVPCSALVYDSAANYHPTQSASSRMNVSGGSYSSATDAIVQVGEGKHYAVSGGSFSSPVPEDFCAEGYIPADDGSGRYGVQPGEYVARDTVTGQGYETLQEALNAGGNICLLTDLDLGSATAQVPSGNTVTLDLNGHDLTSNSLVLYNLGNLTIRDSADDPGTVTSRFNNTVGCGANSATIIESGSFHARECAVCTFAGTHDATVNISGGSFYTEDNSVLSGNGSANSGNNTWNITGGVFEGHIESAGYVACGIYAPNTDTWNVTGGSFRITKGAGVVQRAGVVNLGDGVTIETTGSASTLGRVGDARVVVPCSALVYDSEANYHPTQSASSRMNVTGGSYNSAEADAIVLVGEGQHYAVSGGTFTSAVPRDFCAPGYVPEDRGEGAYGVKEAVAVTFLNHDGTLLAATYWDVGETVTYSGPTPAHPADEELTYFWSGWTDGETSFPRDEALPNAGETDVTYTATFVSMPIADHWIGAYVGDDPDPTLLDSIQQEPPVVDSVESRIGVFDELPVYNENGVRYEYRVVELKIGDNEVNRTYNGYDAVNDYYVEYGHDDPLTTVITNHLIRYRKSQDFLVTKTWADNDNRDGERPDSLNVYLVQTEKNAQNEVVAVHEFTGVLNEANGWQYEWLNYPGFAQNGNYFTYSVREDAVSGYEADEDYTSQEGTDENVGWERMAYTNRHTQQPKSLTVDKLWYNDQQQKVLRPEALTFVLCCRYQAYKYVNTETQATLTQDADIQAAYEAECLDIVPDGEPYEGPVCYGGETAEALLAKYPELYDGMVSTTDDSDPEYPVTVYSMIRTVTPGDRTADANWLGAVTFENLPPSLNTCGTGAWNGLDSEIVYYVAEVDALAEAGKPNPYLYGVADEDALTGSGESDRTTLTDTVTDGETTQTVDADGSVTVRNKLKTRSITVAKSWQDNDYSAADLHYDIDFTLSSEPTASGYSYTHTETLETEDDPQSVSFLSLPIYDQNGDLISYSVTERVHNGNGLENRYGYVQTQTFITTEDADGNEVLTAVTVTNTLPVVRLGADKKWDDNHNQDGKRPDSLRFTLRRTSEGLTEVVVTESDGSAAYGEDPDSAERWAVSFGLQPVYNPNNLPYLYSVEEAAAGETSLEDLGYTRVLPTFSSTTPEPEPDPDNPGSTASPVGAGSPGPSSASTAFPVGAGSPGPSSASTASPVGAGSPGPSSASLRGVGDAAEVAGVAYPTLAAAIAVADGKTVTLLRDVNEGVTVSDGTTMTLELNGHNLTANGLTIYNLGDLTIQDSTGTPGTVTSSYHHTVGCGANSTTNIRSGNFHARECAVCTFAGTHDAVINISGGSFYTEDNSVLSGNGSDNSGNNTWNVTGGTFNGNITSASYVACGIYAPNVDTWNVTGGSFRVYNGAGVVQRAGTVNLGENVTIVTDGAAVGRVGDARVVVPCSALVYDSEANYHPTQSASSRMNVTGGSFRSEEAEAIRLVGTGTHISVSGGGFSSEVLEAFCAEGWEPRDYGEGVYGVWSGTTVTDGDLGAGSVTVDTVEGVTEKTFHFENQYEPLEDELKVRKSWLGETVGETDFSPLTRPQTVTVTLQAKYANGSFVTLKDASADPEAEAYDPVRALFPEDYVFTREITLGENWEMVFADLPVKVNPTGTAVFNGQSYPIVYSVEEVDGPGLNGYTEDDSAYTALDGETELPNGDPKAPDAITISNTLKTKTVKVRKHWVDGYTGSQAQHYDVNLTLTNTNTGVSYQAHQTIALSQYPAGNQQTSEWVEFTVPQYLKDGSAATYTLTEDVTDQHYGYRTSYTDNHIFNAAAQSAVEITVTNTLPLTTVTVNKTWVDEHNNVSNYYNLRPSKISVQLQRRLVGASEWGDCGDPVEITSENNWSYTYPALPKFNAANVRYEYRVVEAEVKAYTTTYPDGQTKTDTADSADSSLSFGVTNTLITAPLTLVKVWNDNGCTQTGLHYPVTFTISNPNSDKISFGNVSVELGRTEAGTTAPGTSWTKQTEALPVYYKDGTPILYTVAETSARHYGYEQVSNTYTTDGEWTGYANYHDSYTITNRLPVTNVQAEKVWEGVDLERYPRATRTVVVELTRYTPGGVKDPDFLLTETIRYDAQSDASIPVTFQKLLWQNADNQTYTYKITERTVEGYSSSVSPANGAEAVKDGWIGDFTVTNTPKTGGVEFVKYDVTDFDKHHSHEDFVLKCLEGAVFELHRVIGGDDKRITVTQNPDGSYSMDGRTDLSDANTRITSGAGGVIVLRDLEPNDYYLKEIGFPDGYQENSDPYRFTVYLNVDNEIAYTYGDQVTTVTEGLAEGVESVYGLPNEQNMSHLTLIKVDKTDYLAAAANDTPLPASAYLADAAYELLRLIDFQYRDENAQGDTPAAYLDNALATLEPNYHGSESPWTYWERISVEQTDDRGRIVVEGHMFGTYLFREVKAPLGYDLDFTHTDSEHVSTNTDQTVLGPVVLNEDNSTHDDVHFSLTHLEPRSKANLKVLKTNENGDPLKDAEYALYLYDPDLMGDPDPADAIATVTTDYDGLNPTAIVLDPAQYGWNARFFFLEVTPPTGYAADNDSSESKRIYFDLTRELAEEDLHIVRANDARLKGKVTLTKRTAGASSFGDFAVGDALPGAKFKLYSKSDDTLTPLALYAKNPDNGTYRVAVTGENTELIEGFDISATVEEMTTDSLGQLHIENLSWGDYVLVEIQAPTGFQLPTGPDGQVTFSVGRNNCGSVAQQLTLTNEPLTASVKLNKRIDFRNAEAWGESTFLFRLRQTGWYDYGAENEADRWVAIREEEQPVLTKTITVHTPSGEGFADSTGWFQVEPGEYLVTEVKVARYVSGGNSVTAENSLVEALSNGPYTASFRVAPGGEAQVSFVNRLDNYEKESHTDAKINRFNGFKELRAADLDGLRLEDPTEDVETTYRYSVTISKANLLPKLIRGDGSSEPVPAADYGKLVVSKVDPEEDEIQVIDNGDTFSVVGRRENVEGSVYRLKAVYDETLAASFEARFAADPLRHKQERTVTFLNDVRNRSYFPDGSSADKNSVYTLIFIHSGDEDAILHNGVPVTPTDETAIPTLVVDELFSERYEFDHWHYTVIPESGTPTEGDAADAEGLFRVIDDLTVNAEIRVRAVLRGPILARIGDRGYATLQEALNEGGTVTLQSDIDLGNGTAWIPTGKSVVLDLAGKELRSSADVLYNSGTLVVNDSSEDGSGRLTSTGDGCIGALSDSDTTINGGTFSSVEGAVFTGRNHGAVIRINGGVFSASDNAVLSGNGTSGSDGNTWYITGGEFYGGITSGGYIACGIYAANNNTWNVSGGSFFITGGAGVVQRAGSVNISGDAVFHVTGTASGKVGDKPTALPSAALVFDSAAHYPGLTESAALRVTGGVFTSEGGSAYGTEANTHIRIAGGVFSQPVPANCCEDGYAPSDDGSGNYTVSPAP